jgi:DNA-binding response OmpR family regulator
MPIDKPRILLVDDEKDVLQIFTQGLERNGFEVDAFTSPIEAVQQFRPYRYDAVITDIRMPGLSGFEVYKLIRKQDDTVKVFFLTAFAIYEKEVKLAFPNLPLNSFVEKPISIAKLVNLIESNAPHTS